MAFDEGLAERIRDILREEPTLDERRMFGGLAFMLHGHMTVGILGDTLLARVGPDNYPKALALKHVRPMDFTGKPMKGYVVVEAPGFEDDADLAAWVAACVNFIRTLPPKL